MARVGDIFEIPLSEGRFAYGQYVFKDVKKGPLIRVFAPISNRRISIEELRNLDMLFPPIFTGINAAIREGLWTTIGNMPVENFIYPNFVSNLYNQKTGRAGEWFLWDGEKSRRLGLNLPKEYKKLEYLIVWSPYDVIHRIETGEYVFPYRDLILYNQFTPLEK